MLDPNFQEERKKKKRIRKSWTTSGPGKKKTEWAKRAGRLCAHAHYLEHIRERHARAAPILASAVRLGWIWNVVILFLKIYFKFFVFFENFCAFLKAPSWA